MFYYRHGFYYDKGRRGGQTPRGLELGGSEKVHYLFQDSSMDLSSSASSSEHFSESVSGHAILKARLRYLLC
jgi:hypothetical protein